jgi:hypothetical protein
VIFVKRKYVHLYDTSDTHLAQVVFLAAITQHIPEMLFQIVLCHVGVAQYQPYFPPSFPWIRQQHMRWGKFDRSGRLYRLLVEGVESGTARPLDMAELKKRAQTLLNQGKRSK